MAEPVPLPIACTLTGASLAERAAWLQRLGAAALLESVRHEDRVELRFKPEAEADVRELVRVEEECCPFLSFEVDTGTDELHLTIKGPSDAGPVLDGMLERLRSNAH